MENQKIKIKYQNKSLTQYHLFKKNEINLNQLYDLKKFSDKNKIHFHATPTSEKGINELEEILEYCELAGLFEDRIRINSGIVRGLGYYTGTVFEAELTDKIIGNKGKITEIGSVAGGGRYDDLVQKNNPKLSGFGISFGFDRIFMILDELRLFPSELNSSKSFLFLNILTKFLEIYFLNLKIKWYGDSLLI